MATVAGQLHTVVLNNILLQNSRSILALKFRLLKSFLVEITLWNEAIVARNMSCHLSSTHCQFVSFVALLSCIAGQLVSGVLSIGADRIGVFGFKIATL
jgi:hypothetical protein